MDRHRDSHENLLLFPFLQLFCILFVVEISIFSVGLDGSLIPLPEAPYVKFPELAPYIPLQASVFHRFIEKVIIATKKIGVLRAGFACLRSMLDH